MSKSDLKAQIVKMFENGDSKNKIAGACMTAGMEYSDVPKFISDSGLKFRRKAGSTWKDLSVEAFRENKDLTKEEMLAAIEDSVKDPEYYVKGYYTIFKALANI